MPRKKSTKITPLTQETDMPDIPPKVISRPQSSWLKNGIIIAIIILAAVAYKYKNLFIVATVDGKPITRLQLEQELNSKYGSQVLDNLLSEQIILDEGQKRGIAIDNAAVNTKIQDIQKQLQGKMSLNDALKAQGLTQESFRQQLKIQLTIDKMFDKEASVSEKEIDDFIAQNKDNMPSASDPAKLRRDVSINLRQQKIGNLFDKWFSAAKAKAKVVKF